MEKPERSKLTTPLAVIRAYCLSCCLGNPYEVRMCPAEECELWLWRFGKNPFRKKRQLSEEEKQKRVERLQRFKHLESPETQGSEELNGTDYAILYLDATDEEYTRNTGEYPTYCNFPEEDNRG